MARAVAGVVAAAVAALPTFVAACSGTEVPESLVNGPTAVRIDRFVRDSLPDFSGQVLVALGDTVVLHRAYGLADRESKRPVTLETVFDVGSLTKQFTAAAIVALAEQGALAVADTLGRFIPGLPPSKSRLTLHQLLTHSSGLPQYSGDDYEPMSAEGLVAWLDTVSLEFSPGERYSYSNPGYSLLALVVERASGLRYEAFLQRRLLGPAGLTHTGYRVPDWRGSELAVGYELGRKRVGTPLDQRWLDDGPSWNLRGNGGMLSTAAEMYRWQHMLLTGRVLPPAAVQRLTTPHIRTDRADRRYGYGWVVRSDEAGRTYIEHTGGNGAFFADVRWYADPPVTFVVTSNAFDADAIRTVLRGLVRFAVDRAGKMETVMTTRARGTFDVKLTPQATDSTAHGTLARMSIDKRFQGDLDATSEGEMLSAGTNVKGSAGYVAIERVSGTLHGRRGTFVLQHSGTMTRGAPQLTITVVPDSGTDQLVGLAGTMTIAIADGKHSYELEYTLSGSQVP